MSLSGVLKILNNKNFPFLLFATYPMFFSEKRGLLVALLGLYALFLLLKERKIGFKKAVIINASIYLVYIIGFILLSKDKTTFKVFETSASIIILPIVFLIYLYNNSDIFSSKTEARFFSIFYWSCIIYVLVGVTFMVYLYTMNKQASFEYYINQLENTISLVNDHPIYISILLGISVLIFVKKLTLRPNEIKIIEWLSVIGLILFLFFLSRKGVIIATVIGALFFFKEKFIKNGLLLLTFSIVLVLIIPSTRERMLSLTNINSYLEKNETNSTNNRFNIYKCAIKKIEEKPIFGYGINDDKKALYNCYKKNLYYLFEKRFNTHNQYMSILMKTGFVGLFVFLAMLIYNVNLAVRASDSLFLSLIVFFMVIMLFENILERQNGVMMFSFIINYFSFKAIGLDK